MEYKSYQADGKIYYAAEGTVGYQPGYPSVNGEKFAKELPCPCGCGLPIDVTVYNGNCLGASLALTYTCFAVATLKFDDVGEWEVDIEMEGGFKYSKTKSGTFFVEGRYVPPHSYHPAEDAPRLIPYLKCPCGCGVARDHYVEHGNCKGATLYLTFPCGAEGQLVIRDEGFWEFDVEPYESHQKPFQCT